MSLYDISEKEKKGKKKRIRKLHKNTQLICSRIKNNKLYKSGYNNYYLYKFINIETKMAKHQSSKIKKKIKVHKDDKIDDSHPRKGFSLKKR